ncbi:transcription termination factor 3, mitochondrial [Hyla sarda]|uniref:transcription termination factor 3, mitochondrial n=1 Tax=Hyla sarda TaxID=327740 RepID=UPI0024C25A35|nr:transcription termination factor 3, mitochondrial [Hyla sarda]XP_056378411.1 transcription termination factor 3, mitochondrial [Hyla sarda]
MALCMCQRSARHILSALRNSLAATPRQLKTDDPLSSWRFSHHFFTMQNPASQSIVQSRAACTHSSSKDAVKIDLPESNLPAISQIQQETIGMSTAGADPLPEALEDVPAFSPLDVITEEEAAMIVPQPPIPPGSYTLRDYVDSSETLQKLVLLGVDLSKLEKRPNVGTFLLKLDFEKDISKILFFLKDVGLEDNQLGPFLTKNPFILSEDLDNLHKRVAYLSSKKFSRHAIARIVSRAPYLLNFSVERLDNRLGFFQEQLGLSGEKTRELVTRLPRMITGSLEPIKENLKVFEIEFGFRKKEIQQIALRVPKMLTGNKKKLTDTFDYVHNTMGIPHHIITHFPQVFNTGLLKLKERHEFLTFLGRAVYDPTQPNYVSLEKLVSMSDQIFCEEIAKTSIQDFEQFQKNM